MSTERARALIGRYGSDAVSFQALTAGCAHWLDADDDACVSYVDAGGAWIAVGGPVAAPARRLEVAGRFAAAARREGRRVRFFATEKIFPPDAPWSWRCIGEQPIWDPSDWPRGLSKKLATQIRQHRSRGRVAVRELGCDEREDASSRAQRELAALARRWLAARRIPPLGFLLRLDLHARAAERRYFVAEHAGSLVAALIAMPVYAQGGWLLETCLRDPRAPGGVVELLIDRALTTFADERARYVSYGLCPLTGTSSPLDRMLRGGLRALYDFEGLRHFKGKLGPSRWQRVHLVHPRGDSSLAALLDVVRAFCPGGLVAFGACTVEARLRGALQPAPHVPSRPIATPVALS